MPCSVLTDWILNQLLLDDKTVDSLIADLESYTGTEQVIEDLENALPNDLYDSLERQKPFGENNRCNNAEWQVPVEQQHGLNYLLCKVKQVTNEDNTKSANVYYTVAKDETKEELL